VDRPLTMQSLTIARDRYHKLYDSNNCILYITPELKFRHRDWLNANNIMWRVLFGIQGIFLWFVADADYMLHEDQSIRERLNKTSSLGSSPETPGGGVEKGTTD